MQRAAILCLLIAGSSATPVLASPGKPEPIDAIAAVDGSESMIGPRGSDPQGARYRAVEVAAAMLCLHSSAGIEHHIGVLPFGSTAPATLAIPLRDACDAQRSLPRQLQGTPQLGGTDYPTMLRAARRLLGRAVPGRSRVLLLITDGRPHVASGETLNALFQRVAHEFQALRGVSVHVVLINSDPEVLKHWRLLRVAAVTPLRNVDRQALERVALRTLAYEFGLARGEELTLGSGRRSQGFTVAPYQDLLGLTVLARGRDAEVTVDGPSGPYRIRTVAGGVGDISIPAPAPGRWSVRLVRGSRATLAVDRHEPTLRLVEPPPTTPSGRPLFIEATLTPLNGGEIRPRSADPVVLSAQVTGADNQVVNTEMREVAPGRYRSVEPVDTRNAGAFTVRVTARGGGVPFSHVTQRVDVRYTPYLVAPTALAVRAGERIELPLLLKVGGDQVDAQQTLAEDPNAAVVADLRSARKFVRSYPVAWQHGSKFTLRVPYAARDGERLTLTVRLMARTGDGAAVSDRLSLAV